MVKYRDSERVNFVTDLILHTTAINERENTQVPKTFTQSYTENLKTIHALWHETIEALLRNQRWRLKRDRPFRGTSIFSWGEGRYSL